MDSQLATRPVAVLVLAAAASALWVSSSRLDARVDPVDTRLLTQPAVSATHLAFIYAGDLFVADFAASEGVPPDIEVEQTPADVIAGRDPQLEKAIEVVLAELKKSPPAKTARPAYPLKGKTRRGTVPAGTK